MMVLLEGHSANSKVAGRGVNARMLETALRGVETGRLRDLYLSAQRLDGRVTDIQVGGSTVPVAKGQLFLP